MKYTLDGIEHDDEPTSPEPTPTDLFLESMFADVAAIIDFFCSIPPLSWLDAALSGSVRPLR